MHTMKIRGISSLRTRSICSNSKIVNTKIMGMNSTRAKMDIKRMLSWHSNIITTKKVRKAIRDIKKTTNSIKICTSMHIKNLLKQTMWIR